MRSAGDPWIMEGIERSRSKCNAHFRVKNKTCGSYGDRTGVHHRVPVAAAAASHVVRRRHSRVYRIEVESQLAIEKLGLLL